MENKEILNKLRKKGSVCFCTTYPLLAIIVNGTDPNIQNLATNFLKENISGSFYMIIKPHTKALSAYAVKKTVAPSTGTAVAVFLPLNNNLLT